MVIPKHALHVDDLTAVLRTNDPKTNLPHTLNRYKYTCRYKNGDANWASQQQWWTAQQIFVTKPAGHLWQATQNKLGSPSLASPGTLHARARSAPEHLGSPT